MIVRVALSGKVNTLLLELANQHRLSPARMLRSAVEAAIVGAKNGTLKSTAAFLSPILRNYSSSSPKKIRLILPDETYDYISDYIQAHRLSLTKFSEYSVLFYVNLLEQSRTRHNPDESYRKSEREGDEVKTFAAHLRAGRIPVPVGQLLADLGHLPARSALGSSGQVEDIAIISRTWLLRDRIDVCPHNRDYRTSNHIANEFNLKVAALQALVALIQVLPMHLAISDAHHRSGYRMAPSFPRQVLTNSLALAKEFINYLQNPIGDTQERLNQFRHGFDEAILNLNELRFALDPDLPWGPVFLEGQAQIGYCYLLIEMCNLFADPQLGSVPLLRIGQGTTSQPRFGLWEFWSQFARASRLSPTDFRTGQGGSMNLREVLRLNWINFILETYL